jgi:hypothetical protein
MSNNEAAQWLFKEEFDFDSVPEAPDFDIFTKAHLLAVNASGRLATPERQWVVGFAGAHGTPPDFCDMLRTWVPSGDRTQLLDSRETANEIQTPLYL